MSKRKRSFSNGIQEKPFVYVIPDGLEFFIANVETGCCYPINVKAYGNGKKTFAEGAEELILGVFFVTAPTKHNEQQEALYVKSRDSQLLYSVMLQPDEKTTEFERVHVLDRTFDVYESHQLIRDRETQTVLGLFISLVNTNHTGSTDIVIRPNVSMDGIVRRIMGHDRYKSTQFFPYDIDPSAFNLRIDPRTIPQRTPLWFKLRGSVSGSKAYTLLGYFVPSKEKDPNWTLDGDRAFSESQRSNMRFGSQSEDIPSLLYMATFMHTCLQMMGWCPAPSWLPSSWGASPDGLIIDKNMSSDDIAPEYRSLDPTRGALEIKSSKTSLKMDPYYIPQIYMEMISLECAWGDLVRYRRSASCDPNTHEWKYEHTVRVFRIYRDQRTEERLISLWKYASEHKDRLQSVVEEPAFVEIRAFLGDLAKSLPYREIKPTAEVMELVVNPFEQYKRKVTEQPQVPLPKKELYTLTTAKRLVVATENEWIVEAEKNQQAIAAVIAQKTMNKQRLQKLATRQLVLYSQFLDKITK